jgi:hypothetical protein
MHKTAILAVAALLLAANSAFGQMLYKILAVQTNTGVANYTNDATLFPAGIRGPNGVVSNDYVTVQQSLSVSTNPFVITGTLGPISNGANFTIPLPAGCVMLTDCRFYLDTATGAPVSKRARLAIMQQPYERCTDLAYLYTNQLYYSTTTTVAGAANGYSNVVTDATGFIVNDMYAKPLLNPVTWQTCSNATSTVVGWNCSNMVAGAIGDLITRVNRWKLTVYMDDTGSTNLYGRIDWTTPYTNSIGYRIRGMRK